MRNFHPVPWLRRLPWVLKGNSYAVIQEHRVPPVKVVLMLPGDSRFNCSSSDLWYSQCLTHTGRKSILTELNWRVYMQSSTVSPSWVSLKNICQKNRSKASLVAQWWRIHLPMQDTWVQSLIWEDPSCCGATNPEHHNYWVCALESETHGYWSLRACDLQQEKPLQWEALGLQLRSSPCLCS